MRKRILVINLIYLGIIFILMLFGIGHNKAMVRFREQTLKCSNLTTRYLHERFHEDFLINDIIKNDYGLVAYCSPIDDEKLVFEVNYFDEEIYYDTYIQHALEKELETKIADILMNYTDAYEISATLKFYNEPTVGDQRDLLYYKFEELKRIPKLDDVYNQESFSRVIINIYDERSIDLKEICLKTKDLDFSIEAISLNRYSDINKKKQLDSYSQKCK